MKIDNISFTTDGKTISVPPNGKGEGELKISDIDDLRKHKEDYMILCEAEKGRREEKEI